MSGELAKLKITKITDKKTMTVSSSSSDQFICQFNPESFSLKKQNDYNISQVSGKDNTKGAYRGGMPREMDITLTFDSSQKGESVINLYKLLRKFALVDSSKLNQKTQQGEPPWVMVQWGAYIGFPAVIKALNEEYTMFKPNGTPIRAKVTISLVQIVNETDKAGTNPTSRSEPRRTWIVEHGQRLDWIAHIEYGDSGMWRQIAEANNIDDPLLLRAGQVLRLPVLV